MSFRGIWEVKIGRLFFESMKRELIHAHSFTVYFNYSKTLQSCNTILSLIVKYFLKKIFRIVDLEI